MKKPFWWVLDWDSCLNQFDAAQVTAVNARYGTDYRVEDIAHWDWWGTTPHGAWVWGAEAFDNRDWTLAIPPAPDAKDAVVRITALGGEPVIVTDRPVAHVTWLLTWLQINDLDLPIISACRMERPKATIVCDLGAPVALDDAPHHLVDYARLGLRVYAMDKPWNRTTELTRLGPPNLIRVATLTEMLDHYERNPL